MLLSKAFFVNFARSATHGKIQEYVTIGTLCTGGEKSVCLTVDDGFAQTAKSLVKTQVNGLRRRIEACFVSVRGHIEAGISNPNRARKQAAPHHARKRRARPLAYARGSDLCRFAATGMTPSCSVAKNIYI
jgi:hypothetical protein